MPDLLRDLSHPLVFDMFIYLPGSHVDLSIAPVEVEIDG